MRHHNLPLILSRLLQLNSDEWHISTPPPFHKPPALNVPLFKAVLLLLLQHNDE